MQGISPPDTSAASSASSGTPAKLAAAKARGARKARPGFNINCSRENGRDADLQAQKEDCELPQLSAEEVVKYKGWWNRMRSKSFEQPSFQS